MPTRNPLNNVWSQIITFLHEQVRRQNVHDFHMHFSILVHAIFAGSSIGWTLLQVACKYRLTCVNAQHQTLCAYFSSKADMGTLKRLYEKPLKWRNMGMLGSLALSSQYFAKQNTYLKPPTDSCYTKYKDGHSEVIISSLQPRIQYVPSISHCNTWLEFTVWLQKPSSGRKSSTSTLQSLFPAGKKISGSLPKCFVHLFIHIIIFLDLHWWHWLLISHLYSSLIYIKEDM